MAAYTDAASEFHAAGDRNATDMLNNLAPASRPDFLLLHLGTNDIGGIGESENRNLVGHHNTPGTIMYDLKVLMHQMLDWNIGTADEIEQIFLARIIPRAPIAEFPGVNANIQDYNQKLINLVYQDLDVLYPGRITIVDMYSPFYANQGLYYTADNEPVTIDDHIHPSVAGYEAMSDQWADYIVDYLSPNVRDQFVYAVASQLNSQSGWTASSSLVISDQGESPGGALYCNATNDSWDHVAIWDDSRGMNSISIRIHGNSENNSSYTSSVGVLVGMGGNNINDALVNRPGGYMVFIHPQGRAEVYIWDGARSGGPIGAKVGSANFPLLAPRDILTVTYEKETDKNTIFISVNGGTGVPVKPSIQLLTTGNEYYSGIIFRGHSDAQEALMLDYIEMDNNRVDLIPPDAIQLNTLAAAATNSSITLNWLAVGDDGGTDAENRASYYDLRYSMLPIISDTDFESGSIVGGMEPPKHPGEAESVTIDGLLSGASYYFAIKASDDYGNQGDLSNDVLGTTTTERISADLFDNLDNWKLDTGEYIVNPSTGELNNQLDLSSDRWGSMALYKAVKNPNMVKMVWGDDVTNPQQSSEFENGGIVMMASDTSLQANGYFIFIRSIYRKIYLFSTYWDQGTDTRTYQFIDQVAYDYESLGSLPTANDTVAVVVDNSAETYAKFDVYVGLNGASMKPASMVSLYDTRPAAQRHGQSEPYYSGLILTRYGNTLGRDNGVKSYLTTSPQTTISGLIAVSPVSGLTAEVNQELADSVRVRVEDQNGLPVEGVPVFFKVKSGDGEVSTPYVQNGRIRMETEWGNPVSPMITFTDATASGGKYIASIQHGGDVRGYATYAFRVDDPGTYYFWARVKNATSSRFAVGFELVGKDPAGSGITWKVFEDATITGDWQWDVIKEEGTGHAHSHFLAQGFYNIRLITAHRDIWLDKLIITRDQPNTWQPTGKEEEPVKLSNADGEAAVAWKLGTHADDLSTDATDEGLNELSVWSFWNAEAFIFTANGIAAAANSIADVSGELKGTSGDTLTLKAQVFDSYVNKKAGQQVSFNITKGDGALLTGHESRTTDAGGIAEARMILGAEDSVKVEAFYEEGGPKVVMTAYVVQGDVGSLTSQAQNRNLHVDSTYTDYLRVLVKNNAGQPMPTSTPVQFLVIDNIGTKVGPSKTSTTTVWTDVNGIAVTSMHTGSIAGIANVIAKTAGRQVVMAQDSVFYTAVHMSSGSSGGQEVLDPGALSKHPVRVYISDVDWNPVKNHPVRFVITDEASGFTFENSGATVVEKLTDNLGFAAVNVRAGMLHGHRDAYAGIVQSSSDNGFGKSIPTPQKFTFFVKSNAYRLEKLSTGKTDTTGVVTEMIGPLKVRLLKADGQPLGNQQIVFERVSGNGSFNPEVNLAKKSVMANADGFASTNFWLGTYAGADSNLIRIYTENYDWLISTQYNCLAQSSIGDEIFAVGDQVLSGTVGSSQTVVVKVLDQGGNPVANENVNFLIVEGTNATIGSGSADVSREVMTNTQGEASVEWTLGTEAGTETNKLHASAHNGSYSLDGSPVEFIASTNPGSVSLSRSELEATSHIMVGPDQRSEITVTLNDMYGNAVSGHDVEIVVLGGSNNFPAKQVQTSDASGVATAFLYSTSAGERTIKGIVDGDTLFAYAEVIFLAGNASQIVGDSGNDQYGNINTVLAEPFVVKVTDTDGNPVEYGPVSFVVYGDAGSVVEEQPVITDADGFARAHFKMGTALGRYAALQVASPNLANKPTFWVNGTNNPTYAMWYPAGYDSEIEAAAGETSPPLTVQVSDVDSKPVAGEWVTFSVNPSEGTNGAIIGNSTVITNEYGQASVRFRMDTRSGFESWVFAENTKGTGKVWFKALSKSGQAVKIASIGTTQLPGQIIGTTITLQVKTTDGFNNPISGVIVSWMSLKGDADILGATQVPSDANGISEIQLRLGNQAGAIRVQASAALEGSPVVFDIVSKTSEQNASNLVKVGLGVQTLHGTVSHFLADSLYARVADDYGNPVSNQPVLFRILSPISGSIISGDGREYSNSKGIVAIAFKCGPTPDITHQIEARWGNKDVIFNVQTHNNASFPVLDKDYISSIYTGVEEGSALWIDLRGSDADGDALEFQIGGVAPPTGAYIDAVQGGNRATFKWTPGFEHGRDESYDIILRVVDGKGGFDEKEVKIFVQNLNQLPRINATSPVGNDVNVNDGQTVIFEVNATDPDGDPLVYSWLVDGSQINNNSAVYHHKAPDNITTIQIIDVLVSDGPFTVTHRWTLNVTTAVELAAMSASFQVADGTVRLMWQTVIETHHAGFDVMRSQLEHGAYTKINEFLINASDDGQYVFVDRNVVAGQTYYYKVIDRDYSGAGREHAVKMVFVPAPERFELLQNYPNPFNPSTMIRFELPRPGQVKLSIYNMLGQPVCVLIEEDMPAGFHSIEWDGNDTNGIGTATGLYLYRLEYDNKVQVRRMIKLH
ncbi:Ig-like domain-containing protein [bacterium]|nr:Ig-like domain-containing protein [bacterium]